MRNLKLTLAYDGTSFHGWQVQPGLPTIQAELKTALEKLFNHEVSVVGSGRTDAGVHAHGQVANVQTIRSMDADAVVRGANALLPPDIRILHAEEASAEFHARRSARSKTYEYRIWRERIVSPFLCRYVYAFPHLLDDDAMDEGARQFFGEHDFTSFSATGSEVEDRVRTIYSTDWERSDSVWVFRISGNGFLQYMVRTIVGTLLYVGQGKIRPDQIETIFEAKDRSLAGPSAPPQGLHLMRVDY